MQTDIYSEVTTTNAIPLVSGRTAATTPTAIDLKGYEGLGVLTLNAELASAGSSPTLNVKLQDCDTEGGSYADITTAKGGPIAFTEVTGAAGAGVQKVKLNFSALKRFVKVVDAIGGTSTPTFTYSVQLSGRKKVFGTPSAQSL